MKPAGGILGSGCNERDEERGRRGRERGERDVGVALKRHPQRHAHPAEEQRRDERERDGLYAPSSACSGVFLPWAKSGTNTWASGPIETA